MPPIDILESSDGIYASFDDSITFERIRHHRGGRMPVGRSAAATRSSRRQEKWRNHGRKAEDRNY